MSTDSNNVTIFPPDAVCFSNAFSNSSSIAGCNVTDQLVSFLNLTSSFQGYFDAYCLNPPADDGCPYGYCPNPDIGGMYIRISAYLTNLLVAIIIFYYPEGLKESFWSQVLTVYSLLICCGISIILKQLSRIHAILATALAGSPLSFYILIYAIRSMWNDTNRMASVLGRGRIISRIIVIVAFLIWIALIIYIILPSNIPHFSQVSCEQGNQPFIKYFYFLPLVVLEAVPVGFTWFLTLPIQFAIIAWVVAIWRRRRQIWPRGERYTPRFSRVWRVVNDSYPYIQFITVVLVPFGYWVAIIEIGAIGSNDDAKIITTFGQVLAIFVTLPPLFHVVTLTPRFCRWFIDLTWVRLLTCRPRRSRRYEEFTAIPISLGTQPHESSEDENTKRELLLTTKYDPVDEPSFRRVVI